ncbi:MAG: CehA/McbA family metallohydrolase, partial [Vicinamibacterales bacterium]
ARNRLRESCRAYFASLEGRLPTAHFRIGQEVAVSWPARVLESRLGARDVVLIKVTNERTTRVHAEMSGGKNDRILFWSRTLAIDPSESRYTFAFLAFSSPGAAQTTVTLKAGAAANRIEIRASGVPLRAETVPRLLPRTSTRVALPESDPRPPAEPPAFPSSFIQFRVRDARTGKPLPARVDVTDEQNRNQFHWTPLRGPSYSVTRQKVGWRTPSWEFQAGPYFYIDGYADLGVDPAGKIARLYHGFEYRPAEIRVPGDGVVEARLERWIDMREEGWYSGQTHIHTTDAGIPVQFSDFWPLVSQAEDLGVSYILTLKGEWETHAVYADEYPMGVVSTASTPGHIIAYGEEYRSNPYGHLALLGVDRLIEPISSGAVGELAGPDYPPNAFVLDAALAMGATTVGAHFGGYILQQKPVQSRWPSTGFEMPVDVALRKLQVAEVYGNAGQRDVWYKLLNCGFELAATAGPDWEIKDTPRTYVFLGDTPLTLEKWTEGLRQGASFITHGPMLLFQVDGAQPGARLHYPGRPQTVRVEARALTPDGARPVEIVVNGQVVAKGSDIAQDITLDDSAWIAARTEGAHTNPIYVRLQGRPYSNAADARDFIAVTERLMQWVEEKGLFDSPQQKDTVLNVLREGRRVFQQIAQGTPLPAR